MNDEKLYDRLNDEFLFADEDIPKFNEAQLTVATIISFDAEIQNGGLFQFFSNSTGAFAPYVSVSFRRIGADVSAVIFEKFIRDNEIDVNDLSVFHADSAEEFIDKYDDYPFENFDDAYYEAYEKCNLTELVIKYAQSNIKEIF